MHNIWSEVAVRAVVVQEMIKHLDLGIADAVAPDRLTDAQRTGPDTKTWGEVSTLSCVLGSATYTRLLPCHSLAQGVTEQIV